jgi:hypothetical protein
VRRFTFREADDRGWFDQLPLVPHEQFGRAAQARGTNLSFGSTLRERLEMLDSEGAMHPIAFLPPPSAGNRDVVFREEVDFRPWKEYGIVAGDLFESVTALYSPWQLLWLEDAIDLQVAPVPADWFLDDDRRSAISQFWRQWYEERQRRFHDLARLTLNTLLLLIRLQNRYMPVVRGTTFLQHDPAHGLVDPNEAYRRDFNPPGVLADLELDAKDIERIHNNLIARGYLSDPIRRFYMLFRAPFRQRDRLEGAARRSQDFYDAADILRRFHLDLTGELLDAPDDHFDGSGGRWKEQFLGHGPRLALTPKDLREILEIHRLYPHRVHLIVEGETDEYLFRELLEAFLGNLAERGISFARLRGVGNVRPSIEVVRAAKHYSRFPILVADREGDIERDVELLIQEGLLTPETALIWNRSLEEDNFSVEELLRLVHETAAERGHSLILTAAEVHQAHLRQREHQPRAGKGLAEILIDLARKPTHGSIRVSKRELAKKMARVLLDELEEARDIDALADRRPILKIAADIARAL